MPKLRPWQWVAFVVFLAFYGFAVFALTRDYYLRHPAPASAEQFPPGTSTWLQQQMRGPRLDADAARSETDPIRLGQLADHLFTQGRYAETVPIYRRLLELTPEDVEVYNDLGLALHYSGKTGPAVEVLRRGIDQDPQHQRIWLSLGFVLAVLGDNPGAREALERARSLGAETPIGEEATRILGKLDAD